jgi:pimeloyl-ACP methyl ester carboxylesterase
MGGSVALVMGAYFPDRIHSIAVIGTSSDYRPLNLALNGLPAEEGSLSRPRSDYLKSMAEFLNRPAPITDDDKINQRVEIWALLNGAVIPLEKESQYALHREFLSRLRYPQGLKNHLLANERSEEIIRTTPSKITLPTIIFLGSEDPIFGKDHGESLSQAIQGSKFYFVEGLGHVPNPHFDDFIIEKMFGQ